ncbi:MAG: hypothetical protein ACOYMN_04255 [Roseimicrobium sp.]
MSITRAIGSIALALLLQSATAQDAAPLPPPVTETPRLLPPPSTATRPSIGTATPAPAVASSTSASGQFIVYGSDLNMRGAFCTLCDETAAALGRVLKDNGRFTLPIIVVLEPQTETDTVGQAAPVVSIGIGELTHGGFHLQINARLRAAFRTEDFSRELVRLLLAERILRDHKRLSSARQGGVLPDWVMTGVTQAIEFRSRAKPSVLFAAVFRRGQVYSLDRILTANAAQLDALSRGIYETSTCALVLTLLDQPEGPVRFSKFLGALATDNRSDRELLQQYFPTLAASKNTLEKWWSLQMAALATPSALETLTVEQTESALDDALTLTVPGTKENEAAQEPSAPATEKKSGGLLGWLKREEAAPSKAAEAPPPPAPPLPIPDATSVNAPPEKVGGALLRWFRGSSGENEKTPAPEGEPAPATPTEKPPELPPAVDEAKPEPPSFLQRLNPFGGKKILFPFRKPQENEEGTEGKQDEKPSVKPKAQPGESASSSTPPKEAAPGTLSRKPSGSRSVAGRPGDLPPTPPQPEQAPEPNESEAKPARSAFNPLNWFRKDKTNPEQSAAPAAPEPPAEPEAKAAPPKPAPRAAKPGTLPLEDFALLGKHPARADIFRRCLERLNALKLRSHQLYRPLIDEYIAVALQIAQGKEKGAAAKLEDLRAKREKTRELAAAIESHLDWYEANHTTSLSHAFDDFLKLEEQLKRERVPRNDAISKYLDAVGKEFEQ